MPACLMIGLTSANSLKMNGATHQMFLQRNVHFPLRQNQEVPWEGEESPGKQ